MPQGILKNFRNESGKLFYFDSSKSRGVEHRNPSSIFYKNDVYVPKDQHGFRDVSLEKDVYGSLDNDFTSLARKLIESVRSGKKPKLTAVEKSKWDRIFYHQFKRSPEFFGKQRIVRSPEESVENAIQKMESSHGQFSTEARAKLKAPNFVEQAIKRAVVGALKDEGQHVVELIGSRGLWISRIVNNNESFIIGSRSVMQLPVNVGPDNQGTAEIWMPISHDVAIGVAGQPEDILVTEVAGEKIRLMNETMVSQSQMVAGKSKELLISLLGLQTSKSPQ